MAIKTTYFVNTTVAADNAAEVYAWLQENATEYFDSFAISDDGLKISCFIGELEAVNISGFGDGTTSQALKFVTTLNNGTTCNASAPSASPSWYINKAIKTSNGIAFCLILNENAYKPWFFITKAASGETAFVFGSNTTVNTSQKVYAVIPTKDSIFTSFSVYYDITTDNYTSIANVVCPSGVGYLPNVYRMVSSQYRGTEGIISLNGKKYYTNGYLALAE